MLPTAPAGLQLSVLLLQPRSRVPPHASLCTGLSLHRFALASGDGGHREGAGRSPERKAGGSGAHDNGRSGIGDSIWKAGGGSDCWRKATSGGWAHHRARLALVPRPLALGWTRGPGGRMRSGGREGLGWVGVESNSTPCVYIYTNILNLVMSSHPTI
jgi:hypothetical protein